jgi:RHS repeat-associated protein
MSGRPRSLTRRLFLVSDPGGYTYDATGNMTYDGFNSYTYDAEGNITAVTGNTSATYVYNALNQRVRTVASGATTEFVFNANGQRVSEWNGTTHLQLKGKYYWGGKPVAYYTTASSGSAGAHFEHTDWLGTERLRTTYNSANNPAYAVEASYTSLPWGDAQTPATNGSDAAHYAQLDHDAETNTDHADFRQYSNTQGRWFSPDPYDGSYDGSNPQSMNRYVYAANSPLSNLDPSGQDSFMGSPCTWTNEDGMTCPEWKYDASYSGPPPTITPTIGPLYGPDGSYIMTPCKLATNGTNGVVPGSCGYQGGEELKPSLAAYNAQVAQAFCLADNCPYTIKNPKSGTPIPSYMGLYVPMEMTDFTAVNVPPNLDVQVAQFLSQSYWYNYGLKVQASCSAASAAIIAFEKAYPGTPPPPSLLQAMQNCWKVQ